ncbi:hypothetical protein QFC19_009187 [Naganishia cerealis]|uniref:Uncharacterized protein n=1 Tax=Naganishia cerealis TaxID=610337 RepID=A0ACC2UY55_9TREE|nr:hypothetical protein QFC19_009187 [Naganishia cerealis]
MPQSPVPSTSETHAAPSPSESISREGVVSAQEPSKKGRKGRQGKQSKKKMRVRQKARKREKAKEQKKEKRGRGLAAIASRSESPSIGAQGSEEEIERKNDLL